MKEKVFNFDVHGGFDGNRIDKFLQSKIDELSRTKLQALIHAGQVKLNNTIINSASKKNKRKG